MLVEYNINNQSIFPDGIQSCGFRLLSFDLSIYEVSPEGILVPQTPMGQAMSNTFHRCSSTAPRKGGSLERYHCPTFRLVSSKGTAEDVIAFPLNRLTIPSTSHPLFTALMEARNEPAVRQWFSAPQLDIPGFDRTCAVVPEVDAGQLYRQLVDPNPCPPAFSSWMLIALNPSEPETIVLEPFITVGEVAELLGEVPSWSVVGAFSTANVITESECRVHFDYFLTKGFCNEAKSTVLFQIAAYLQALGSSGATFDIEYSEEVIYGISCRTGNLPVLRLLQKVFRLASVARGRQRSALNVQVQLSENQLVTWTSLDGIEMQQFVEFLASRVACTAEHCALSGAPLHLINVDQFPVAKIPTPFDGFVEHGKAIWAQENAPVVRIQPNLPSGQQAPSTGSANRSSGSSGYNTPVAMSAANTPRASFSNMRRKSKRHSTDSNNNRPQDGGHSLNSEDSSVHTVTPPLGSSALSDSPKTDSCHSRESSLHEAILPPSVTASGAAPSPPMFRRADVLLSRGTPVVAWTAKACPGRDVVGAFRDVYWRENTVSCRIAKDQPYRDSPNGPMIVMEIRRSQLSFNGENDATVAISANRDELIRIAVPVGTQVYECHPPQKGTGRKNNGKRDSTHSSSSSDSPTAKILSASCLL